MITKIPPEELATKKSRLCLRSTNTRRDNISEWRLLPWVNAAWTRLVDFFVVSKNTVYGYIEEINTGYTPESGRIRGSGGGRKPELNKHPE